MLLVLLHLSPQILVTAAQLWTQIPTALMMTSGNFAILASIHGDDNDLAEGGKEKEFVIYPEFVLLPGCSFN